MDIETVFTYVAVGFEAVGALAMIAGFVIAVVFGWRSLRRVEGGNAAFMVLRTTLGAAILLGLEVLVAADLIRTITSKPSMEDALIRGIIVLIRTIKRWLFPVLVILCTVLAVIYVLERRDPPPEQIISPGD